MTLKERNQLVKSWLWRYRGLRLELRRLQEEYDELVSVQESVSAIRYDGTPGSSQATDLSSMIVSRSHHIERMARVSERLSVANDEISTAISMLDRQSEQRVMSCRYLRLKTNLESYSIAEVSEYLKFSVSQTKTIHGAALNRLYPIIKTLYPGAIP